MLMEYLLMLRKDLGKGHSSVKVRLTALGHYHLAAGVPDPLANCSRVWMALRSIKREEGSPVRKLPVTPEMLQWVQETSGTHGDYGLVLRAALNTGYFFLLRAGEYVATKGQGWNPRTMLLGRDVEFRREGKLAPLGSDPDEVTIRIRGSKTDQLNVGEVRNHLKSGARDRCVVTALSALRLRFPERFGDGTESHLPAFRWAEGAMVTREQVQQGYGGRRSPPACHPTD